jgi:hypothetical protein
MVKVGVGVNFGVNHDTLGLGSRVTSIDTSIDRSIDIHSYILHNDLAGHGSDI